MEEFITPLSFSRFEEELKPVLEKSSKEDFVDALVDVVTETTGYNPGYITAIVTKAISDVSKDVNDLSPSTETRLRQYLITLQAATDELLRSTKDMPWLSDPVRAKLRLFERKDVYELSSEQVLSETYALLATADPKTVFLLCAQAIEIRREINDSCQRKVLKALADWFETQKRMFFEVLLDWMVEEEDDGGLPAYYRDYSLRELTALLRKPSRPFLRMTLKVESMSGVKRTIYLNRTKLEVSPGQTFESLENMIDFLSRVFPAQDVQNEPPPWDSSWNP